MSLVQKAIRIIEDLEVSYIRKSSYSPLVDVGRGIKRDIVRIRLWTGEYTLQSWAVSSLIREEDAEFLRVFVSVASKEKMRRFNDFLSVLCQLENEL